MHTLRYAWLLARKDLRLFLRDRTAVLLGFLLPIVLVSAFGFVMQFAFGGGSAMVKVTLHYADEDDSEASRAFVAALRTAETIKLRPRAGAAAQSVAELRAAVEDGESHHALVIAAGFADALAANRMPTLRMFRDPGRGMEDRMIRIGILQAMMTATQGQLWPALMGDAMRRSGMSEANAQRVMDGTEQVQRMIGAFYGGGAAPAADNEGGASAGSFASGDFTQMIPVDEIDLAPPARPKQTTYMLAQNVSGVTVMMLMFGLVACGSTLLVERDHGTLRRLLIAGAPRGGILAGKFLFTAIVGLIQLGVLFGFGELVFGVGMFRDIPTLLVLSLTLTVCVTSFGMLVAVWAKTQKQAEGFSTLIILSMSALGGAWFPVQLADLPPYAEMVPRCTLTWWAMTGFQNMLWSQKPFTDPGTVLAIGVQLAFAAVAMTAAWRLFRRRYAR